MGIVTFTSGAEVIGRIEHDLQLDNSDWIAKAPLWIADIIADMDILPSMDDVKVSVSIVDYQCLIPINLKMLTRLVVNGIPLTPHLASNQKFAADSADINHATKYSVLNNTYITFGVETGTADFYYKIPAVEVVDEYKVVMPKVIDNIHVFESIKWGILVKMIHQGYKHPIFSLNNNNPYTNPAMLYDKAVKRARNDIGTMDQSERRVFSELTREFIKNYEYFYNEGFITVTQQ